MTKFTGDTVEEAIQTGLQSLKTTRDKVDIQVTQAEKRGFLGIGKKAAIIEITILPERKEAAVSNEPLPEEVVQLEEQPKKVESQETEHSAAADEPRQEIRTLAKEDALKELALYLTKITEEMGAPALVRLEENGPLAIFHLDTEKKGLLIGHHGKTLNALQYLAQIFIHRVAEEKISVSVDVGDYRERRRKILENLAKRTAADVAKNHRAVFLDPMPAFERKIIHSYLSSYPEVQTHSEGEEPHRYLVVELKS